MSASQRYDMGEPRVSPRVLDKVRSQFPGWAAASWSRETTAANDNNGYSEFLLSSDWMLRPEGLAELSDELEKSIEGARVAYNSEFSSFKIRCLASEEDAVMGKCQSLMDKIVQRELSRGLDNSKHIMTLKQWRDGAYATSKSEKKKYVMALAPSHIRDSMYRTAWIMPDTLVQKDVVLSRLVPSKAFVKLQNLTGCKMMISGDGLCMYIGAESEDEVSMAERKLTTLAKYASIPSEADLRCESFIYAEDQQGGLAKFTYMAHGAKEILKTFFLDRMVYSLAEDNSAYGRLFDKGVVVTMSGVALKGANSTPVTSSSNRGKPYIAFSSEWHYRAKQPSTDVASSVPFDPNPRVTSWITKLPTPELMLPHGDGKDTPDPESGIHKGLLKATSNYNSEHGLTQKEIYEQQDRLLPHQISQVIPTLPKATQSKTKPQLIQENTHEQKSGPPRQANHALPTLTESGPEQIQKTMPQWSPEGMPKQRVPEVPRGGHTTLTRGRRGNSGMGRGDRRHNNGRQGGQRKRGSRDNRDNHGNRGNRNNHGDRGNRGNRGNHGDGGNRGRRPAGRQRPTEQLRMNSRNTLGNISDRTPLSFPNFSQSTSQNQPKKNNNTVDSGSENFSSTSFVAPHLRYLIPGAQRSTSKEASQDTHGKEGILIDLESDKSDDEQSMKKLQTVIDEIAEEMMPQSGGVQSLPAQQTTIRPDPFAETWNMHLLQQRQPPTETRSYARDSQGQILHSTMKQQAGSRSTRKYPSSSHKVSISEDPAPQLIEAMTEKISHMLGSLEVFPGQVSLKAQIGRFCLTKINRSYLQTQGDGEQLHGIKEALDKHHANPLDVMFTNILTSEGADANHIAFMNDSLGKRMWNGDTRRTVYEITCRALTTDKRYCKFIVEVDGDDFTYQVRQFPCESSALFIHCPKRSWDFKVSLSKSQDLGEDFNKFAEDLIRGMRIVPQKSGVPIVEITAKRDYQVDMLAFRTRNIASYTKFNGASDVMEICEVHDMDPSDITEGDSKVTVQLEQRDVYQQLGQLGTWYEVSMQSKTVNKALQQNRNLEFGEEVDWSPKKLQETGAFDELIRSTIEVVKNIDGVGYWGDNNQDTVIHGMPLTGSTTSSRISGSVILPPSIW
ncbi:uncharacterized protein GGS22DRAFT_196882 [Annulohypoxylon maeteangense]|uniref:uncharacterized protein n=1 Tax=Annulohypoxylon maeteangense TaxID=1927788 RepID=UPI002007C367|nr:uncharacterized protein GGS22DRAFT_196882 [Annulohypoxylon maeteangense]KAI0889279.1 hypothetical protein GGS22DRAFT_196882 [Annulohypoxylon maeteangense]